MRTGSCPLDIWSVLFWYINVVKTIAFALRPSTEEIGCPFFGGDYDFWLRCKAYWSIASRRSWAFPGSCRASFTFFEKRNGDLFSSSGHGWNFEAANVATWPLTNIMLCAIGLRNYASVTHCHMSDPWHAGQNRVTHLNYTSHMCCLWDLEISDTLYIHKKCTASIKIFIYHLDFAVWPKWASELRTYRTPWEGIFTTTFTDTKCIIYKYLWFVLNNFFNGQDINTLLSPP